MRMLVPVSVFAAFVVTAAAPAARTPAVPQAAQIEAGKALYDTQKCRTCHMIGGVGSKASSARRRRD